MLGLSAHYQGGTTAQQQAKPPLLSAPQQACHQRQGPAIPRSDLGLWWLPPDGVDLPEERSFESTVVRLQKMRRKGMVGIHIPAIRILGTITRISTTAASGQANLKLWDGVV